MRADGRAFNEIARTLNADGVPSPGRLRYERGLTKSEKYRDALWLPKTIRKIATDRVYLGYRIHGKIKRDKIGRNKTQRPEESWQIIENAHPAIVERELFEKIQRINQEELAKRERYGACNEVTVDHRSLFRGKVVCGECGHLLTAAKGCARPGAKSGSRVFFDCSTYKKSNHTQCSSHYIRQETLFHAIQHTLDQQVRIAVDFGKMLADVQKMPTIKAAKSAQTKKQVSLRVKRQNIENKLEQLLHDLTTGLITRDEYEYIKRRYNEQYAQIQSEEIALRETMKVAEMQLRSAEQWLAEVKRYQKIYDRSVDSRNQGFSGQEREDRTELCRSVPASIRLYGPVYGGTPCRLRCKRISCTSDYLRKMRRISARATVFRHKEPVWSNTCTIGRS